MNKTVRNICIVSTPLLLGAATSVIIGCSNVTSVQFYRLEFLLDTIISCSTTISGFILAAVAILVGASSSQIMQDITQKALPELRWRYSETLILGLVVMVYFSCMGVFTNKCNCVNKLPLSLSAGLLVAYIYSVVITCYFLLAIVGKINERKAVVQGEPSSPEGDFR